MGYKPSSTVFLGDIILLEDSKREPLSSMQRASRKGQYPYYGAQGIVDYLSDYTFEGKRLLVAEDGENLRSRKLPIANSVDGKFRVNNHAHVLCETSKCNIDYLRFYLNSTDISAYITGSTQPKLSQASLLGMRLDLPPKEKQDAIASFLAAIERKINLNTRLNGYLEELLLAQFTALSPNENWTEGRADSYYEIGIGKTPPRKEPEWFSGVKADNHVWLSIKDMGEAGTYSLDSSEYLTDAAVNAKNVRRVPAGSVLLSFKLTVGRVKIAGCNMTTNEAIACFASDDKRKLAYAYPYLRSFDYGKLGSTSSIATAVNSKTVKAMPFAMPGDLELSEFYLSTKPIYEQLLAAAKESRFLAQLRDVLLPKLMSGEIDVSKIDLTQLNSHLA